MNLLDVHEIGISFGGLRVLSGITFHIKESCKQKSIAEMKKVPQNLHS